MKISETVVTVIITILGILPFIWFTYIGRKSSGKSKNAINNLLKAEGLTFANKELWNHNFIGIDEVKKTLLFLKIKSTGNEVTKIDLSHVKACHIDKVTREYKREKKIEFELQTLNLEFIFTSKEPNVIINFYDINDNLSEDLEMKRAEKWHALVSQIVNKNSATDSSKKAA